MTLQTQKTIGLLGGMSWESTATYYQMINESVKSTLGGLHSAKILMHSFDFAEVQAHQASGDWQASATMLAEAAAGLEKAGADFILICTNTMHKVADAVQAKISVPLLHIADSVGGIIEANGYKTVALLGTRFTMEQDFYRTYLSEKYGVTVLTPNQEDRDSVHNIIYNELCLGKVKDSSRETYVRIIEDLKEQGAEAIILGCTEIAMLVGPKDTSVPLLDTTELHAGTAVAAAII